MALTMFWPFWSDHHHQKYFGLRLTNPFSLAPSNVQRVNALALGRQILLYSPASKSKRSLSASEMDAPASGSRFLLPFQRWRSSASAQWVRQRQGANFCSPFKRSASAIDDVREAELPHYASALGPNSYHSPWFLLAHLL